MVAIRASGAEKFIQNPPAACVATLVFGPDVGLVGERAKQLSDTFAGRETPASEIIRIEDSDLDTDPDRLVVELQTMPMFGGGKVVRTRLSRKVNGALFKDLFQAGQPTVHLVVEGGNLRPSDATRKLFESTAWAASVPCYADNDRDLASLVKQVTADAGLSISPDALELLVDRLGADRALSRGEIDKLVLYAHGRPTITAEDVLAIVGDASESAMDDIIASAASGDAASALSGLDRVIAGGESAQSVLLAAQRYFLRLHRLRSTVEAGKSIEEALRGARPPVHFSLKDTLAQQCRVWSLDKLARMNVRLQAAVKSTRLSFSLEVPLVERVLLDIAGQAGRGRRN